ncbi:LOW QUALITY PROTEIN: uncharacterized protein LOC135113216 [Scylla paramamosain]|uniref:LOW QUALITY PROTEIN: uncharacterized protein LOC135113216 n=1 Tax=Scylla paramamosain TaxID=85552 RepID=UPI003082F348
MFTTTGRRRGALYVSWFLFLLYFIFLKTRNSDIRSADAVPYDEYECGCPRFGPSLRSDVLSLCSEWSSSRGGGQKVVAYSVYGDVTKKEVNRQYYSEIEERAKDVASHYEGWVMRLYHNISRSHNNSDLLCVLYCRYPHLDLCLVTHLYPPPPQDTGRKVTTNTTAMRGRISLHQNTKASYEKRLVGKMWRFLPMADPLVSEFLVRDLDSSILPREVAAVRQWRANSTALVHLMRDHPSHNGLILAGMWGGSRERGAANLTSMLHAMTRWPPRDIWDYDQMLLKRVVWPEVLDSVLAHDSYFCANPHFQSRHRAVPFPTRRDGRLFVGWGRTRADERKTIIDCPVQCRPRNHLDWRLC